MHKERVTAMRFMRRGGPGGPPPRRGGPPPGGGPGRGFGGPGRRGPGRGFGGPRRGFGGPPPPPPPGGYRRGGCLGPGCMVALLPVLGAIGLCAALLAMLDKIICDFAEDAEKLLEVK